MNRPKLAIPPIATAVSGLAVPVIVLGSGVTPLGTLRSLARAGVPTLLLSRAGDVAASSRHARPAPGWLAEGPDPNALAAWLTASPISRAVLMPCSDDWLKAVAGLPPELKTRFPTSLPDAAILETLLDKGRFANALEELGVPGPRTRHISSDEDLADVELPGWFLKPCDSQRFGAIFGLKAFLPRDDAELLEQWHAMREAGIDALLQEYVPGPPTHHVFIDGFRDRRGRIAALFARRRLRMHPVDFGNSTIMESIPLADAAAAADSLVRLLEGIGYRGIFSAEFKRDERDGVDRLLEVNARPWWYVEFATLCGVNVCWRAWLDALERDLPGQGPYVSGRRFVNLAQDIGAFRRLRREGKLSTLAWLRSLWGAKGAHLRLRDWRPALSVIRSLAKRPSRPGA